MVFWTLQSKFVVEQAKEEGVFHPDFSFSSQQHISDCTRILDAFNNLNRTECKGLIFCLAPEQFQNQTNEYRDLSNIKELFHNNTAVRNSLAVEPYSLFDKNHVLLKIDGSEFETTNTIPIDYWNHIIVMDGGSPDVFYFQKDYSDFHNMDYWTFEQLILTSIKVGKYIRPIMPTSDLNPYNTMTELHIPFIRFSSILEIYEASEL